MGSALLGKAANVTESTTWSQLLIYVIVVMC